jgi:hypothetical protein
MVSQMLAKPTYGLVSQLGQPLAPAKPQQAHAFLVLTLLIEAHASYRGIQTGLRELHGLHLSLGSITSIIKEAGRRAQNWLEQQQTSTPRMLALDEQYGSQRGKAYLKVIDVHRGHVWTSIPPVQVDGESWTLVLWYVQEQGISRLGTVSDGGRAIAEAVSQVQGEESHQRDVWHLLHTAAQVQGRLDRAVKAEQERLAVIRRQAELQALGKRQRGRRPKATLSQQTALLTQMSSVADGMRYLCQELHTLVEVVIPHRDRLLSSQERQGELEALLELLEELIPLALPSLQGQIRLLSKQIRLALPLALLFARRLDAILDQATLALGTEAVSLVAWAWLRRVVLGPTSKLVLQGLHPTWRAVASDLLAAWDQAVRASRAVENWQSIVRPHLAVHRTLSAALPTDGNHLVRSYLAGGFGLFCFGCLTVQTCHMHLNHALQDF